MTYDEAMTQVHGRASESPSEREERELLEAGVLDLTSPSAEWAETEWFNEMSEQAQLDREEQAYQDELRNGIF
jgi:hypothetical protein